MNNILMCPFCFYADKLVKFRMKMRSGGYSRKRYACPDCHQIMYRRTLFAEMDLEQLAKVTYAKIRLFNRIGEKYYDRLSMDKIAKRVKERGWGNVFWEAWKEAKTYDKTKLNIIIDSSYTTQDKQTRLVK